MLASLTFERSWFSGPASKRDTNLSTKLKEGAHGHDIVVKYNMTIVLYDFVTFVAIHSYEEG